VSLPDVDDVLAANGDQPEAETASAELAQRRNHARPGLGEDPQRVRPSQLDQPIGLVADDLDRREIVTQRPGVPRGAARTPDRVELGDVPAQQFGGGGRECKRLRLVVVDERLEKIEDDGVRRHVFVAVTAVP
jgi:hypothetical protein